MVIKEFYSRKTKCRERERERKKEWHIERKKLRAR